jgi:hypothetical protein
MWIKLRKEKEKGLHSNCWVKGPWLQVFMVVKKSEQTKGKSGREPKKGIVLKGSACLEAPGRYVSNVGFPAALILLFSW